MNDILKNLPSNKIEMNWNENPIKVSEFLGFLTVPVEKSTDHLGSSTGWTQYNGENGLIVSGGWVRGVEYLDSLQYGKKLSNPYNNYVNPFFLWDILNDAGKAFFLDYYKKDIDAELNKRKEEIKSTKLRLASLKEKQKAEILALQEVGFKF